MAHRRGINQQPGRMYPSILRLSLDDDVRASHGTTQVGQFVDRSGSGPRGEGGRNSEALMVSLFFFFPRQNLGRSNPFVRFCFVMDQSRVGRAKKARQDRKITIGVGFGRLSGVYPVLQGAVADGDNGMFGMCIVE